MHSLYFSLSKQFTNFIFQGNFLVKNVLISEEVDLLQGRISKGVFVRHYLKENISEFKRRVLEGASSLEKTLLTC